MKTRQAITLGMALNGLFALAPAARLQAATIATNGGVPASMTTPAGTEGDPSVFLYTGYTNNWAGTAMVVGNGAGSQWIRLVVQNGSVISNTAAQNYLGVVNASNDQIVVTGPNSLLSFGGETRIGNYGSYNTWTVQDQAVAHVRSGEFDLGGRSGASLGRSDYNAIVIDHATFEYLGTKLIIGYQNNSTYNTITVKNGGKLVTNGGGSVTIGRYGSYNDVTVAGFDSVWTSSAGVALGTGAVDPHHNTLTIGDRGLVKLSTAVTVSISQNAAGGSYVRFAAGFLAMAGDRTATGLVDSKVQVWDGTGWIAGVKNSGGASEWTATYYADESSALAATDYSGLGGYTVFTGGLPLTPEPDPGTVLLVY